MPDRIFLFALLLMMLPWRVEAGWDYPISEEAFYSAAQGLDYREVRRHPEYYLGTQLLLAGEVVQVDEADGMTMLTIDCRPLDEDGRPRLEMQSCGRFLLRSAGVDRETYAPGRQVTLTGALSAASGGKAGLPVFTVVEIHPWPTAEEKRERQRRSYRYDPWYDPFCDPWYHRYPWHAPYPYRHCW